MTIISTGIQALQTLISAGDPSLPKDLRESVGLVTTDEEVAADIKRSDDEMITDLAQRMGSVEQQVRGLAELDLTRDKLAELAGSGRRLAEVALNAAAQADSQAATTAEQLARVQWALQEQVASAVQKKLIEVFGDKYKDDERPQREHVRRAVEETVEAAREATTLEEERLLIDTMVGSLTPAGMKQAIGARLRKLVTSGKIGPAEVYFLRRCAKTAGAPTQIQTHTGDSFAEAFALASATPALVTVQVTRAGRNGPEGGYITSLEQFPFPAATMEVRITDRGHDLLRMLQESTKVALGARDRFS